MARWAPIVISRPSFRPNSSFHDSSALPHVPTEYGSYVMCPSAGTFCLVFRLFPPSTSGSALFAANSHVRYPKSARLRCCCCFAVNDLSKRNVDRPHWFGFLSNVRMLTTVRRETDSAYWNPGTDYKSTCLEGHGFLQAAAPGSLFALCRSLPDIPLSTLTIQWVGRTST